MLTHRAVLSIGSNIGDKLAHLRRGLALLELSGAARISARSRFFRTRPVDFEDQDWFVNAAVVLQTALPPRALLAALKAIERQVGRRRKSVRFGPRVLDMDIVLYDDLAMESEELTIPHPRMHKRRFVLMPICDIDPRIVHPVLQKSMAVLLTELEDPAQEVEPIACG
jgi:2-amino-4-hydroxy-6-hydroxymethyldihydropteridine diphosphokinase